MQNTQQKSIWYPLLALAMLFAAMLACDNAPAPVTPDFAVRRDLDSVWAGAESPLPQLHDNDFHPLVEDDRVTTDDNGEALIEDRSSNSTCKVYLFRSSQLLKRSCPKSSCAAGNTSCLEEGSAVYRDCNDHLQMTPSGEVQFKGSWVQVIYLPEQARTFVIVFEGKAAVQPVIDPANRTLGALTEVESGYFWFTDPGVVADEVAGLAAREPHPIEALPPVISDQNLDPWLERSAARAVVDNIPFPVWATATCAPGVVFCENFETGLGSDWNLETGWQVAVENGNHVLLGSGHQWANLTGQSWDNYRLRFQLKLLQGTIHLMYQHSAEDGPPIRYFIGFNEQGLYLEKQIRDEFTSLASVETRHQPNRWYNVEIVGWQGHLQVYVDGRRELDYTDATPLRSGSIAFETLDDSQAMIDNIEVHPSEPEQQEPVSSPEINLPPEQIVLNAPCERCTTLNWSTAYVHGVYVDDEAVLNTGSREVCLDEYARARTLNFRVVTDAGDVTRAVTVRWNSPQIDFHADANRLTTGECTTLRWDVEGVRAVYFEGQEVAGHGSQSVCPTESQVYTLRVLTPCGEEAFIAAVDVRAPEILPITLPDLIPLNRNGEYTPDDVAWNCDWETAPEGEQVMIVVRSQNIGDASSAATQIEVRTDLDEGRIVVLYPLEPGQTTTTLVGPFHINPSGIGGTIRLDPFNMTPEKDEGNNESRFSCPM